MNKRSSNLKKYIYSTSKIAGAILIVIISLGILIGGYFLFSNIWENHKLKELAEKKEWPKISKENYDITISLATKWSREKMSYIIKIDNYSIFVKKLNNGSDLQNIFIEFYDSNGFKIEKIKVPLSKFSARVNKNGNRSKLVANSSNEMLKKRYKMLAKWSFEWK